MDGLAERARERGQADIEAMAAAEEGPSLYYVRTSVYEDSPPSIAPWSRSRACRAPSTPPRLVRSSTRSRRSGSADPRGGRRAPASSSALYFNAMLDPPDASADAGSRDADLDALLGVVGAPAGREVTFTGRAAWAMVLTTPPIDPDHPDRL